MNDSMTGKKYKNKATAEMEMATYCPPLNLPDYTPTFRGEFDVEGVYVYQAYKPEIADYAIEHQQFGGPAWKPTRMTWIKPSFAWMLYRSGYGLKPGQTRVLKIKLSHQAIASILNSCKLTHAGASVKVDKDEKIGKGQIQWDPERDPYCASGREPRKMSRTRAIQIGMAGPLSEYYVQNVLSIQDVTDLAHQIHAVHAASKRGEDVRQAMEERNIQLPRERPYLPQLTRKKLTELAMLPGTAADHVKAIGKGMAADRTEE